MRRPTRETIRTFQRRLLAWYRTHGRDLPWRRTRSPYRVLVSEIMLQQTQVERVLPKYREFLRRYPTIESLARARVGEVRKLWYPLGYNIRPVRLHMIARETVARYHGRLPDEAEALRALPGIGRYTAGAVLSFAYGRDAAVLDTNVRRVLGRVFLGPRRAARIRGEKVYWDLAEALVPAGRAYDFNQALMDFGAIWCSPRRPRCMPCPMKSFCAFVAGSIVAGTASPARTVGGLRKKGPGLIVAGTASPARTVGGPTKKGPGLIVAGTASPARTVGGPTKKGRGFVFDQRG